MRNSDTLLKLVSDGNHEDALIARALDALQEDAGCQLLSAVLAVATAWRAGCDARDLRDATAAIADGSPYRGALLSAIAACAFPDFPTSLTAVVVEGDCPPVFLETSEQEDGGWFGPMTCTVGCRWILARVADEKEKDSAAAEALETVGLSTRSKRKNGRASA